MKSIFQFNTNRFSHSRPHSPSEAGSKPRPLAFVTQRVTATLIANRVPLG